MKSLDDWLEYIGAVHPTSIDLGLERVLRVAERLDVVRDAGRTLIVAGTNGKGSTSIFAENLLRAAGYRVGTTLSPHLHRFNERIRIDGDCASDADICASLARVDAARGEASLTYFEFAILAALSAFKQAEVDVRVLEVGLGGRLDAVNVCDPDVSVITNVGIDHQHFLGNDRDSIGREKAGVLRADVPAIVGELEPPTSVLAMAEQLGTPLYRLGREFTFSQDDDGWGFRGQFADRTLEMTNLPMPGVALVNAATALAAVTALRVELSPQKVRCAAGRPGLPGRLDVREVDGRVLVFDVAHNVLGGEFVASQLRERKLRPQCAVAGFLQDKDVLGIVASLEETVGHWLFVDTHGERGQSAAQSFRKSGLTGERGTVIADIDKALERSAQAADCTLVLGSFDVVERARQRVEAACRI